MKKCYMCESTLDPSMFYKDKSRPDGLTARCKKCEIKKQKDRRDKLKDLIEQVKSFGCHCCDENDFCCIDLHHIGEYEKEFDSQIMLKNKIAINKITEELKKCITVCANCHRKIHANHICDSVDQSSFLKHINQCLKQY